MSIGSKIYELRTAKNLSQGELADLLDVSRQSVSKWETDAAIPDLDRLMKLCDVFEVSLDELTGRVTKEDLHPEINVTEKKSQFTLQNVVGCVLLGASLIGIILTLLLAEDIEDTYVILPLLLSATVCGVICLCVKKNAVYWCMWEALSPLTVLTPHIASLPFLSAMGGLQIIVFVVMGIVASKKFNNTLIQAKKSKTALVIIEWLACIAAYVVTPIFFQFDWISLCIVNFAVYSAIALLLTYTVCYAKSAKRKTT